MVSILMAVYNGGKYLQEQLDSIESQTMKQWKLIIRDDGSTDQTVAIIEQFRQNVSQEVLLLQNDGPEKGAKYNFLSLLNQATDDYVMFCDQDDIWKKDKIEKTLKVMQEVEEKSKDKPILVHSDLVVTDADGQTISNSFFASAGLPKQANINTLLVQNHVTGCTIMINKALLENVKNLPKECRDNCIMHDYWVALYAQIFGEIHFLDETTMFYRQHGNNSVGAKDSKKIGYLFQRLRDGKADYAKKMEASRKQMESFCGYYQSHLEQLDEFKLLKEYSVSGQKGKLARCGFYIKNHVWKNGFVRKVMQLIWG